MVKKKATQVKKKVWRRQIDSKPALEVIKEGTATAAAQTLDDKSLFFTDTVGDERLKRKVANYPAKFYTPKERVAKQKLKKVPGPQAKREKTEVYDIWGEEEQRKKSTIPNSHIPAILPPLAGQSYNPKDEDRERVLLKVAAEEQDDIADTEHADKVLHGFTIVDEVQRTPEESENEDEGDYLHNPPVAEKKLTEKQRKRMMLLKLTEKMSKKEALERRKGKQYDQIPSMISQLKAAAEVKRKLKEKDEALKALTKDEQAKGLAAPKFRMGTFSYKAPLTEADLSGTSKEALRKVEVKGNLVETFFDSVTRRKLVDRDEGRPKRPNKEVMKNRLTGGVSAAMQEARKKRKLEEASGSIALQRT
mmetsp:Transcript_13423/g.25261  ORF Transcript_13423/g.25261 Transcript_13423/m.25261 type:complete len:363 (+) Transcript_13423:1278-2366(+)|eukprot:CAMPEP_0204906804 /NCGR_PEP_ID=MMETSP1397-20131031/6162_1 /ASSEMBLY_ACC=CAM_ASM_000891 /TAXON_ID=49980 /ORGANISM="Climacostomum Climacostomum virens, Strain Stock W-24" /LENGTH=362 /DNA_ID=CAMNT_0052075809 /DNA_START=187 /DNA_END=1278 /DNA_ORIENTATION=-